MKFMHKLQGRVVIAFVSVLLLLSLGGLAYASAHNFGYTLPGYQENVTVQAGTRSSASASAAVSVYSGGEKKLWLWCDAPSVNTRLTNSVLVTGNNYYSLPYWNKASGSVYLRGCTDGWQSPNYISGRVTF